jgi:hypothetical protein
MKKQGAVMLGTGGDNGNGSSGTFYEGAMTTGYPTEATTDAVQANIVAAGYDVPRLGLSRITTFTPRSTQQVTETFTNTTGSVVTGLTLGLSLPAGWTATVSGASGDRATFGGPVAPGGTVSATFTVTSPAATGAGFVTAMAEWTPSPAEGTRIETTAGRVRNVLPIKVNEVRFNTSANATDQFIELYNASSSAVDLSNWTLVNTQSGWAPVELATIPAGTMLASGAHYLLGLSNSGLAAPADRGSSTIHLRSTSGLEVGHEIQVGGETRRIAGVGTAAALMTTVFNPVSTGLRLTVPAGATHLPVATATGFEVGQKIGIDIGGNFEVVTVTAVGRRWPEVPGSLMDCFALQVEDRLPNPLFS